MRRAVITLCAIFAAAACNQPAAPPAATTAPAAKKLGIRPAGDTELQPDLSQVPPDLQKVFAHIDENIDAHVEHLQKWIRQPSISNSGEGIPESAEMVKGFFDELGCQQTQVFDVGVTEYGTPGNPVVYAKCDEGAEKTLLIYWMYDTMPVTQPDAWTYPPFEGRLVEQAPYKKVLIGRGATNSKGPQMSQLNALRAIKAVHGKLPGERDLRRRRRRGAHGHRPPQVRQGSSRSCSPVPTRCCCSAASPTAAAAATAPGSEGCVYVELTTSGKSWGRGPLQSDIHGSNKRSVDSPAWRHIKMLASLVSDDGNTPKIDGFYEGMQPIADFQEAELKTAAERTDLKVAAENVGVGRFISDDPFTMLKMQRYGTSFNLDGIWGGNMYAGGAGAILPNKVTSKHNFRYVPNMTGPGIVKKLRAQLDKNGYKDVEVKLIGDVPWAKMSADSDLGRAMKRAYELMNIPHGEPRAEWSIGGGGAGAGGYWPAYMFGNGEVGEKISNFKGVPIVGGGAGNGGRAHAANEYYVIEGAGKVYGMAGAEKTVAALVYAWAGKVPPSTAKPTTKTN